MAEIAGKDRTLKVIFLLRKVLYEFQENINLCKANFHIRPTWQHDGAKLLHL